MPCLRIAMKENSPRRSRFCVQDNVRNGECGVSCAMFSFTAYDPLVTYGVRETWRRKMEGGEGMAMHANFHCISSLNLKGI